ncbi:uncharacterized protein LOC132735950 [Ruditapes philippinarum]|uniref:uncharacterized protein LOC132735950 n=1 Tax=Ruditapes philippinarum TaxID=129788 RepID=UPI00295BA220|nr:uncharacterized protein LOC132735950 [Ruditapes philippinarum]
MKEFVCFAFILVKTLAYSKQDDIFGISCNMKRLSWSDAVRFCKYSGGELASFVTGLRSNIDALNLDGETEFWMADYLQRGATQFCGFNYLNSTVLENAENLYGDCNANRNYFCKNAEKQWVVYNSSRRNVQCNEIVQTQRLSAIQFDFKSGYYWTSNDVHAKIAKETGSETEIDRLYCGVYKRSAGKYYANCKGERYSLCNFTGSNTWTGEKNTQCFGKQTTTIANQSGVVSSTDISVTSQSKMFADTSSTSRRQQVTAMESTENKSSKKTTQEETEQKEERSDIGVKIGLPVGIIFPLTCGVLIIMYVYKKRIKCWHFNYSKSENRRINQFHQRESEGIHGQLNVNSENIQDSPTSLEHHTIESNPSDISVEYALVKKPKKSKIYSNNAYQNSKIDEYDIAGRFQYGSSNPSNNLYNYLESDKYSSTSFARKGEKCNNLYNTAQYSNHAESTNDSTTQANNTALPDDVYNHLS